MATNPPITIGELTDVPAPGSGVKSSWHQEITNRIPHRFATAAARNTSWPAATAGLGALSVTQDTQTVWIVANDPTPTWRVLAGWRGAWTLVTAFQSGWTNFNGGYQPARYRQVGDQVFLEGLIAGGAIGSPAFFLPVGFRPASQHQFAQVSNGLYGNLLVAPGGQVQPGAGSPANFQINCNFSVLP